MSQQPIAVRVARAEDAAVIAAIYAPIVRDTAISFETEPPNGEEMARRIASTLATHPWLVAEDADGQVLGYAYASKHQERGAYRWSVNVSAYLAQAARGQGLGRRLYGVMLPLLRRQGFRRAFAGIALPNAASVGLHEAMGFEAMAVYPDVGFKLGAWRDVGWWSLALSQDDEPPAEPVLFPVLARDLPGRLG
ncbi:MAG TPA: arsinothricin resistance N-acetyltransferase ArsN1 family B [Caulobacteraceae bacterium]